MTPTDIYNILSAAEDDVEIWETLIEHQFSEVTVILDNDATHIQIDGTDDYIVLDNPVGMSNGAVCLITALGVSAEYV